MSFINIVFIYIYHNMSNDLYREYSRILRDEKYDKDSESNKKVSYKTKYNNLTIEFSVDKKNRTVKKTYNEDKSFQTITKTWISNGDVYTSKYIHKQYDEDIKEYFKNGVYHRENKPAYISEVFRYKPTITTKKWYENGVLHNYEGCSYFFEEDTMYDNENPHYYCEEIFYWKGQKCNKEEYDNLRSKYRRTELTTVLYNNDILCKDMCGIVSEYVW